ncbi:MAG: 3-hydroxy-9,10-secoandrosta-1,3,5(10)-triene-9,17-dione monooxygenase [Candidatus Aldehydirespiratoraceae bacterium]|jgi:3-hydroxy-9,10-secoandrosta-1,3,5(10)-triene-9,17-dione monooxygenase
MTLTHDEILRRSERLSIALAGRAEEAESLRRLPAATVDDLVERGFFPMVVPKSLGGHGLGIESLAQSTRILGQGCVASAWTASFLIMHSWLLSKFPPAAQAELFSPDQPWALSPAPLAPTGTLIPADGGYIVSGRWEWATGVHHGRWLMVHAIQTDPESTTRFVVVPVAAAAIEDVWYTSGMRATGSDTVVLDNVFVPSHRTVTGEEMMFGGELLEDDGMAQLPVPQVLALVAAAPALGAAERAVELYRERINERVLAYSLGEKAVEQPSAQMRLGSVMSELDSIRTLWDSAIDELATYVGRGEVTLERRTALRLAAATTVRGARSIINSIAEGAGASVYFDSSPFQRLQRDVEVLKGHVIFDWDRTTELAGRVALGFPLKPTDMV